MNKKIFLFIINFFIIINLFSQTIYCTKFNNELIINKTYLTISYNLFDKIPNYVGYKLTSNNFNKKTNRLNTFYYEENIPAKYRQYNKNYSKSGYDKGHMSPAANWVFSKQAMYECFSLANICPQNPNLNRKYWTIIENKERKYAKLVDTLYVITGQITYSDNKNYLKNYIRIPDVFYKTCIGIKNNKVVISIGWIYKNDNNIQYINKNEISIDEIERIIDKDLYYKFWFNEINENKILILNY